MDRRNFIKGLLVGTSAGTAMVKLASPAEAKALAVNSAVILRQPDVSEPEFGSVGLDVYVRHSSGRFVPIGVITQLEYRCDVLEGFSTRGTIHLMPGMRTATAEFKNDF